MKKLMLLAMAVAMVTVAFGGVALGENRHRSMPLKNKITGSGAGIQDVDLHKVPEFPSNTTVNAYAVFSVGGGMSAHWQQFCETDSPNAGSSGDIVAGFAIGVNPAGVIVFATGTSAPIPVACLSSCTPPFPIENETGLLDLGDAFFGLFAFKPLETADGTTQALVRFPFPALGSVVQFMGSDACGL